MMKRIDNNLYQLKIEGRVESYILCDLGIFRDDKIAFKFRSDEDWWRISFTDLQDILDLALQIRGYDLPEDEEQHYCGICGEKATCYTKVADGYLWMYYCDKCLKKDERASKMRNKQ